MPILCVIAGYHTHSEETMREASKIQLCCNYIVRTVMDEWTEPHSPWQNPAELNGVKYLKTHAQVLLDRTGAPSNLWFLAQQYLVDVFMVTSHPQLKWQTPLQVSRGDTPDISHILVFQFFEPVLYLDPRVAFPETKELPGYFVGFAKNTGDALTFKICLLYTSPSPRDGATSRMPSSA